MLRKSEEKGGKKKEKRTHLLAPSCVLHVVPFAPSMNLDQHSWLVHKLCGGRQGVEHRRAPAHNDASKTTTAHGGGTTKAKEGVILRSPGTLAEVFVQCVKEHREALLEDETQRLSTALMSLQSGGGQLSSFQSGVAGDGAALSTPLVRQYDDVSARQHERLNEQQREVGQVASS